MAELLIIRQSLQKINKFSQGKKSGLNKNQTDSSKSIKQILLSIAVILGVTNFSFAQTFSNTPNDSINKMGMMEDVETLNIQQLNISSNTITLKWKKVSESIPIAWEASVCDNKICYTSLIDSGMMNPVVSADRGYLLVHITPHVNYGTAVIRYAVWDIVNSAFKDTLTFILKVSPSGISETENKNVFSIFPNPVTDQINILSTLQTGFICSVTDIAGKEILTGTTETNSIKLSIEDLSGGIYFFQIKSKDKLFTQKFIKQ